MIAAARGALVGVVAICAIFELPRFDRLAGNGFEVLTEFTPTPLIERPISKTPLENEYIGAVSNEASNSVIAKLVEERITIVDKLRRRWIFDSHVVSDRRFARCIGPKFFVPIRVHGDWLLSVTAEAKEEGMKFNVECWDAPRVVKFSSYGYRVPGRNGAVKANITWSYPSTIGNERGTGLIPDRSVYAFHFIDL